MAGRIETSLVSMRRAGVRAPQAAYATCRMRAVTRSRRLRFWRWRRIDQSRRITNAMKRPIENAVFAVAVMSTI